MRTTLNLDAHLLKRAADLTGISQKTALIHLGLEALIQRESGRRLARLGGSIPSIRSIRRRRPGKRSR
ncbi:MAG TPA: type II toxin-antitoxin system VapB family antitoxin [bacterium]